MTETLLAAELRGRTASLATRHGKLVAVAPTMRELLGLELVVPGGIDTDAFGTFTGEIERVGTPGEVCLRKARLGVASVGCRFGLANEGSFGPHPMAPFIAADIETVVFLDGLTGLVASESVLSERTNYDRREVRDLDGLGDWLQRVQFPSHALIVRPVAGLVDGHIDKGITALDDLATAIDRAVASSPDGAASVETDMRAHVNPTRMSVIRAASIRLAERLATPCPSCASVGWGRTAAFGSLACEHCGSDTALTRGEVFGCAACDHTVQRFRPDGLVAASPAHCPCCNP